MPVLLAEVIPGVQSLSRTDKLRLIELLAKELAGDEETKIEPGQSYPVWSPESAFGAADVMLRTLTEKG